jgi:4-hydroxy-tetrahydrodipicolinate synthase
MTEVDRLRGSMPPLITPFRDDEVDYETYRSLVEFQIAEGSHGILVNGTTSEPASLTVEERNRIVDIAMETVGGRLPVVAATGSQSLAETRRLTEHAAEAGVDALLIVTPYYSRPPQRGIIEYYLAATREISTPWMIYHIPGRAAVSVTIDTVKELLDRSPTFIGMKHASPDLELVSECLAVGGPRFKVFVGLEALSFPMMAIGACGLMNAVGNLRPRVLADLCEAVWRNDLNEGRRLHDSLLELNQAVFFDTNPIPMKYMAKRLNIIPDNTHRLPMMPATPQLEKRLDALLARAGLVVPQAAS